jgi:hypothetical protein
MSDDLMSDAEFAEWIKRHEGPALEMARQTLGLESVQETSQEDERKPDAAHAA